MKQLEGYIFVLACASIMTVVAGIDIKELLSKMSVEEKCGQMTQVTFDVIQKTPAPIDPDENPVNETALRIAILEKHVGSILNTPYDRAQKASTWQKIISIIQDVSTKDTKNKIPNLYGIDSIHGGNYIRESILFPQPLSMAASFNTDIAHRVGQITAMETRATGIPWNFNPVLDVGRQPLWPRLYETYGEDVHLAIKMGENYIHGLQGNNLKNRTTTASCLKHYIGYSLPFNGRDRTTAYIPEVQLREYFLPPFEHAVSAGSLTAMINSADVNGRPGHSNGYYINDILKGELKFQGFTVSDWLDIIRLHERDKIAETPEEAVRIAVMNGLDMSMVPFDFSFYDHCVNLAKKDAKFAARVDDANIRILSVKDVLGLFENPYPVAEDLTNVDKDESHAFNLEAARESIILAKNEANILPINPNSKILVTGPSANILRVLNGGWSYSWLGQVEELFEQFGRKKFSVFESIKSHEPSTTFVAGVNFTHELNIDLAVQEASRSDIVVLCIGEDAYTETPGNINDLTISEPQRKLAHALFTTNKPVIVVYLGGRPRIMTDIADRAVGVILGFLPGNRGAEAIADIMFGAYNPNARLPITYPRFPNGITTYDHVSAETKDGNEYEYLFPFGHGLSYTQFTYSQLTLSSNQLEAPNQELTVQVTVRNSGSIEGKEVVMLFLNDEYGSVPRPLKQLKKFTKINLKSGESQVVTFKLNMYDLSFIGLDHKRTYESGNFNIFISNLNASFTLKVPDVPITPPGNSALKVFANKALFILTFISLIKNALF